MSTPIPQGSAIARDANKVIAKLQARHGAANASIEREWAVTATALEELQEQYAALAEERDRLLVQNAELTEQMERYLGAAESATSDEPVALSNDAAAMLPSSNGEVAHAG